MKVWDIEHASLLKVQRTRDQVSLLTCGVDKLLKEEM